MKKYLLYLLAFSLFVVFSCDEDSTSDDNEEMIDDDSGDAVDDGSGDDDSGDGGEAADAIIWDGEIVTFSKESGDDPSLEENQDRITDIIWITRGNDNGEIYNIKTETEAVDGSPGGTEWAIGDISDFDTLTYTVLRDTFSNIGRDIVDVNLVLHLIEENIYLTVKFTDWGRGNQGNQGAFTYERSSASN